MIFLSSKIWTYNIVIRKGKEKALDYLARKIQELTIAADYK